MKLVNFTKNAVKIRLNNKFSFSTKFDCDSCSKKLTTP